MPDGIHLLLSTGELVRYYFKNLPRDEYSKLGSALKGLYSGKPEILDIIDP